jgi:putative flippase GtrA
MGAHRRPKPSRKPQPKVAAGGIGGSVVVLIVYALGTAGIEVPAEVATAAAVVVGFAAGYLKKP